MKQVRALKAEEIEVRVHSINDFGSGKTKCQLLLYKDARVDMNILDETYGPMNWQRDHKEVKGVLYGGVGIWCDDKKQWVWKWDAGTESFAEASKGESSDSFKRSNVNWGPGRELYSDGAKGIDVWLTADEWKMNTKGKPALKYNVKFKVGEIVTVDGHIEKLVVVDQSDKQRHKYDSNKIKPKPKEQPKGLSKDKITTLEAKIKEAGSDKTALLKHCKVTKIEELTVQQYSTLMTGLQKKIVELQDIQYGAEYEQK